MIGRRQHQLLSLLERHGAYPSRKALYSKLLYYGRPSNQYGDAVLRRLERRGLVKRLHKKESPAIGIEITDKGKEALENSTT